MIEAEAANTIIDMAETVTSFDWPAIAEVVRSIPVEQLKAHELVTWAPLVALAEEVTAFAEKVQLLADSGVGHVSPETVLASSDVLSAEALKAYEEVIRQDPAPDAPLDVPDDLSGLLNDPAGDDCTVVEVEISPDDLAKAMKALEFYSSKEDRPIRHVPHTSGEYGECGKAVEVALGTIGRNLAELVEELASGFPCQSVAHRFEWSVTPTPGSN